MSEQTDPDTDVVIAYGGGAGTLSPKALEAEIRRVWSEKISSEQGRAEIARALGVEPDKVKQVADSVPFASQDDTAGFAGVDLVIAAHWAAINIVVPVLIGLAKDEVKARVVQLWRQVMKPGIDGDGEDKFGDERATTT
jgi:hypothetical protein